MCSRLFTVEELIIEWVIVTILTHEVTDFSQSLLLYLWNLISIAPLFFIFSYKKWLSPHKSVENISHVTYCRCISYFCTDSRGMFFWIGRQDKVNSLRALNSVSWGLESIVALVWIQEKCTQWALKFPFSELVSQAVSELFFLHFFSFGTYFISV